ncbi:MAG: hypothetical protein ABIJ97_11280, partial [Bacteroidota bacterium]
MKKLLLISIILISINAFLQSQEILLHGNSYNTDTLVMCSGDAISLSILGLNIPINSAADFNNYGLPTGWICNANPMYSNPCGLYGADGTPYAWMGPGNTYERYLVSPAMMVNPQTQICFDFNMAEQGSPSPCEGPDEMDEGVSFQYSVDNGNTWIDITYFCPDGSQYPSNIWAGSSTIGGGSGTPFNTWANYCFNAAAGAIGTNTKFRWIQTGITDYDYDHWGIDNISFSSYGNNLNWYEAGSLFFSGDNPPDQYPINNTQYIAELIDSSGNYYDTLIAVVDIPPYMEITGLDSHYCIFDSIASLSYTPAIAIITGPGISGNTFDPALADTGHHIVNLEYDSQINFHYFGSPSFWEDDFSIDKGWIGYGFGGWERNPAAFSNNCSGGYDPINDHSPGTDNIHIGNYIGDCYGLLDTTFWLESPVIDCSGKENCLLRFYSQSGCENSPADNLFIDVYDGTTWNNIYTNAGSFSEIIWTQITYNISTYADNNPAFKVRFGIGPTDGSIHYQGWNIDDLSILADGIVNDTKTCNYLVSYPVEVDGTGEIQEICMVTVDPASQKNTVIWEKTDPFIDNYYINKETIVAGVYNLIGVVPADSAGIYIDDFSNPGQQSDKYKLSAIDRCGNISDLGNYHKTIHLNVSPALPQGYALTWQHYEGFLFDTYVIYRGSSPV